MPKKMLLSVLVLTKNEELNIRACLESVKWADEIFIVDSGSTDNTLKIASKYTEKIYNHPFENYAKQRNWSQANLPVKNEFIFHIDADERVEPELIRELDRLLPDDKDLDGIIITRKLFFRDTWIKHGGIYPSWHLRIFKKSKGKCEDRLYDQHYIVDGTLKYINAGVINAIEPNISLWKKVHRKWASLEAEEILSNRCIKDCHKNSNNPIAKKTRMKYNLYYKMPLFIRAILYFLYRFIFKMGFLDGKNGILYHFWQGLWYRLLVDLNIYRETMRKRADQTT